MSKIKLIFILAIMLPLMSNAQRYIGIATSNWSGTNGMYLNPANIADSRHKFTIDLFSINLGVNNNLAQLNNGLSGLTNIGNDGISSAFTFTNNNQFSLLAPYFELRGPGAMVSINSKHSIAITTRVRAMNQFHNFNQDLYRSITDTTYTIDPNNTKPVSINSDAFNYTTHAWSEIGLSYAGVIYDGGDHFVKGGFTLRYLMGAAYVSMVSGGINATAYPFQDSLRITNTSVSFGSNITSGNGISSSISDYLGGGGSGFGADLGVVYEWRPDHEKYRYDMDGKTGIGDRSKNKYKLRFSASVVDLGSIKYKTNNFTASIKTKSSQPAIIKGSALADSIGNFNDLKTFAANHNMDIADTGTGSTTSKVYMPTAFIVGVDYHAVKGLYVNAMFMSNMANREKFGTSYYNQLTVTPRWDTRVFSAGIPLTYDFLTKSLKYGLGLRVGGFFLGSDDLTGIMGKKGYGANFYFGASIPINNKKPKDSDGDGVSNKKDKCKNEKGVWEERGCPNPDKDGDGVLDKDDNCPDVAGSKTANGCPDSDLDGVADAEDRCPTEAGAPGLGGCPDRDADGIADIDDVCPDVPGLAEYKGCPDTDGDGIPDNEDKCPQKPGPIANEGCPDTDNDGIPDHMDKCPTVAGTKENYGCPEVSVQVKKRLAFAATAIQFDLGKATIKKTSHKLLDEVVAILNEYKDYNMTIDGYTDNTGNAERNLQLSKERANAVKEYFISKGISAERLTSDGHGIENPVASNKTAAGRAKNRRVEMDLKLK
ncbi:MAG: OmpA family protein [Chitinophagaceae bacterium]|nr:OmpA family protein [Chitinophagaceae bacterium]MCB9044716.1 OmpA family protein [Chitinophagales bacterium]